MIIAEMEYEKHYSDFHTELEEFIKSNFEKVESGHQGDSYIWIFDGNDKVTIDTFSSMKHQIKCSSTDSPLLDEVIKKLTANYNLHIYEESKLEPHEEIYNT